jgi:hypothetical protein
MKKDMKCIYDKCITCRKPKSRTQPHGLYIPLPIPNEPWVDISMDFVLGLPSSKQGSDANLVITWSRNPHAKTPIPGKPSKSGLIGV